MDSNGQGALEYLLLIGAAVLIAAVVIVLLTNIGQSGKTTAETSANTATEAQSNLQNQLTP
ncbi:MAG: class III signal peptide-containing protein [Candidatus Diapherotrites archaeon]|nr:class III signal peptide-containing protein [Candidatus Diapherotrites archaeon]